jgi:hypothetical protein
VRALAALLLLAACAGGPPPAEWRLQSRGALDAFHNAYLRGNSRLAELEFARARSELASTGSAALVGRAELLRCALRTASLEFDDCPGFETLRSDAGAEELDYAEFLAGRRTRAASDEPLSRLVAAGVAFRAGRIAPGGIAAAIEIASSQGWRRPLLAWLGVEEKRALAAGDAEAAARIRRRAELVTGATGR